ncbi:DUF397 domain-containing protein [Nocardiopsis ganjiahuensis]|uniref:DUF397 domain-containing protein n=1 Tax=Nocardiopsis ganjiahuensis TaxID=239984 RepID=UPI00034CC87F|nr:DUF397 domain-containing protein [Nocardiopsis ganjiahuensis]
MRPIEYPQHRSCPRHRFRKSSYSMPTQGDCVEVSDLPGESAVRDSRHRRQGALRFPTGEWRAALTALVAHTAPDTRPTAEGRPASTGRPS